MDSNQQLIIINHQTMTISSLSLDKEDLKKICDILQESTYSAAEIETRSYPKGQQTEEEYQNNLIAIRNSFELLINISGKDDEETFGTIEDVFSSASFPEEVKSLFINSESRPKNNLNYIPSNSFEIHLDFRKPKIFDLSFMPSNKTPNKSYFEVKGIDALWVDGVFSKIKKFIDNRKSKLSIVHNNNIYDMLLWIFGVPFAIWFCFKISPSIKSISDNTNIFIINALYVYVFFAFLFIFRLLFHYLRWICPLVEYKNKSNKMLKHRFILASLSLAMFGQFIYDIIKWLFNSNN